MELKIPRREIFVTVRFRPRAPDFSSRYADERGVGTDAAEPILTVISYRPCPVPVRPRGTGMLFRWKGAGPFWTKVYYNGIPKMKSPKTTIKREAEAILRDRLAADPDAGILKEFRKLDCESLYDDLVTNYKINHLKSGDHLERRWRLHLRSHFGHMLAGKVEVDEVKKYVAKRMKKGAENASINRELAILRRMFSLAVKNKKVKADAVPFIEMLAEDNTRSGFLESRDQDALAQACGRVGLWMRAIFEVGVTLGWRYREVVNLRVRQLDFSAGTVRLDPGSTKNGKGRECPMMPQVRSLLAQCVAGKEPDDHVFTRDDGSPVRNFRSTWINCCREAKVSGLMFHDLRRSAARNLRNAGVAEQIV